MNKKRIVATGYDRIGEGLLRGSGFTIAQSSIEPDTGIGTGAHLFALAEKPEGSQG